MSEPQVSGAGEVISVRELRKRYGALEAVRDVSFSVGAGEIFGIVGPNGAGKTTTVECLIGLRRPDGGTIRVLGLDPGRQKLRLREQVGVQLQQAALPDDIKVWEALELFGSLYRRRLDARKLLVQWGLLEKRKARFRNLSGGERQRVFVALALVNDPRIVFLDELTAGLDPQARRASWELIEGLRQGGKTVVLVTHSMDEAEALCDRVAVIDRGRVLAMDSPRRLIEAAVDQGEVVPGRRTGHVCLEDVFLWLTAPAARDGARELKQENSP